jgi:hypothetical protein
MQQSQLQRTRDSCTHDVTIRRLAT